MKKINLSEIKNSLTKQELNKLMAGSGDVNNTNTVGSCCLYQKGNVNSQSGCYCYEQ